MSTTEPDKPRGGWGRPVLDTRPLAELVRTYQIEVPPDGMSWCLVGDCDAQVPDTATYCPRCGTSQRRSAGGSLSGARRRAKQAIQPGPAE